MADTVETQVPIPVLETKLRRPSTPLLLVTRPRLLDQTTAYLDRRLILVSAPAGYGKTALISQWLEAVGVHAWLSLDEQDNDLSTFLLYLVAAIRVVYGEALASFEQLLKSPVVLPAHRVADALLQGLATLPGPLVLALDDYHVVKSAEVHALMARLLEHLPEQVRLVLITRADPPLPLERLRGRQQLGEIRAADLRFSAEETRQLLQNMLGEGVSDATVSLLEDGMEGWAVGLHLAGLSLRQRSDPAAIARKIAERGHQAVTEYLLSEVLGGLPEAMRDCLLQSSLFERFCAPLIDAVQAGDGTLAGEDFLRAARRGNLFIVSLDDEGTWFRYHHFFQSLLRARLIQRTPEAEVKATHARGGAWFRAQGLADEAVIHFLKAGYPITAAKVVEAQAHHALDREDWREIERWLALLPSDLSSEALQRPRLLLAQAWLNYLRYQFGAIKTRVEAAAGLMRDTPGGDADTVFWGEVAALRSAVAQNMGDARQMLQLGEAAIAALAPQTGYTIGVAYHNYIWGLQASGEYEQAVEFARRQLDASGWQPHALNMRVLLGLANVHYEMADVPSLLDLVPTWQVLARQCGVGLSLAWSQFGAAWIDYQRNDLDAAEMSFCRFTDMAWSAHGRAVIDGYTGLALTALAKGSPGQALNHIRDLRDHLLERGMLAFVCMAQSLEQRVALAEGSPGALDWRPDASAAAVPVDVWEQPALTYARTLIAAGHADGLSRAAALLADCRAQALARHSVRRLIEVGALQAQVLAAQGDETAALDALGEVIELAAPGAALRLLVDSGPGLIPLLRKVEANSSAPRYVRQVLAAFGDPVRPAIVPLQRQLTPEELLTNREIDVLVLLAQRLSDKEIAERLVLSPVTVKKHTQRIYRKLGVDNRRSAVIEARRWGLI